LKGRFLVHTGQLQFIFWLAAAIVAYVYIGYPLVLAVVARPRQEAPPSASDCLPSVSLLISAYNERTVIEDKIKNTLTLDYPRNRLSIFVISDCSEDGTDNIVLRYAPQAVHLVRSSVRLGKTAGLNLGVKRALGDILVFSDANAMYKSDAIRFLVRHFADPGVGYVVGNARYLESSSLAPSAASEGLYWKLETWMKQRESEFGSVVGGDGAIYAIRRELYTPLRNTDINDFLNPLQIVVRGYRGVYEPSAVCFEEAGDTFEKEFLRKVRIVSRSLNAVRRAPRVLLPWTQPRHWFSLCSHKILRWFAPVFLVVLFAVNLLLWSLPVYRAAACLQLAFYALAAIAWLSRTPMALPRFLYLPYYFCLVNLASLLGVFHCFSGSLSPTWQPIRQDSSPHSDESVRFAKRGS
jgi:cellulose synthase/poly-beta-1,6-N-acetylglucosamine synthase-like glycosyltransferase